MKTHNKDLLEESLEFLSDAEAITHRPLPRFARGTVYLLAGLIVFVILWASLSEIDKVVTTRGKLVTTSRTILIQPFVTSVILSLDVREGQTVKKGQTLGTFDPTFSNADLSRLRAKAKEFMARMGRLEAELQDKESIEDSDDSIEYIMHQRVLLGRLAHYQAKIIHYDAAIVRLKVNQKANLDDQNILTQRLASAQEIEDMESLMQSEGNSSKLKVLLARDQRLGLKKELLTAINQQKILKHQISTGKAEKMTYIKDWRRKNIEELSNVRAELRSIEEQIAKAARLAHLSVMRSPVDAVVLKIEARSIGSVVREAEPLITLVPFDAPLEARLEIQEKDIGYVRSGDLTRIKLDAYPFQKHGVLKGSLRVVSEDAFVDDKRGPSGGFYYEAKAILGETKLKKLPNDARLMPGMTLTGEIVVGKRSVISYFLYPVFRMMDESIREP